MRENIWATNGGIYFGQQITPPGEDENPLTGRWSPKSEAHAYRGDRMLLTIGPNGSGKSRRLLVPNLHRLTDWSIVAVDVKGELTAMTALHRMAAGNEVMVIDPFGVMERNYPALVERHPELRSRGFNPVAALNPESPDFVDDAKALAQALITPDDKGEKHWAQSAQALAKGLAMATRLAFEDASLCDLRNLLGREPEDLARLIKGGDIDGVPVRGLAHEGGDDHPAIPASLNRFAKIGDDNKELQSILSTALTQTDWLDSKPIRGDLQGETIDFASLKAKPTTVYLILPPKYLATHATWLRVMITSILLPLLNSVEDARVPVLFMLDEFAALGHMPVIENNMALMRGYGLKLWPVLQDLGQLSTLYGQRWESFIGNAGVLQAFAPQDKTTREYLSELSGKKFYELMTRSGGRSTNFGGQFSQGQNEGTSTQNQLGPVWWPQDLGLMEEGRGVLFSGGKAVRGWFPDPSEMAGVSDMLRAAHAAAKR